MTRPPTPSDAVQLPDSTPSKRVASSEVVEPAKLSPEARARLVEELYAVHLEIFAGVERDAFVRYVVESKASRTWIQLHRDEAARLVGYFAVHLYEHALDGETVGILRAELGMLRAYRGQRASGALLVEQGIRYLARHPFRKIYLVCSPIHPASYATLLRNYGQVWPRPSQETPAEVLSLMCRLADEFHLEQVHARDPYVRHVGWRTRESDADRAFWRRREDEGVQFYLNANPGYGEGHGLLTLVPGSPWRGLAAIGRMLVARWRRALRVSARTPVWRILNRPTPAP